MRLAAFIESNIEPIAEEWERFAATMQPEGDFARAVLRNSIVEILKEITTDMARCQNERQRQAKSEGRRPRSEYSTEAAEDHAVSRVQMGVSPRQLASEFRALRATVIRLWRERGAAAFDERSLNELTRFNEAVDEALAEALERYTAKIEHSRELFLGVLSHDMRNPLAAISASANLLSRAKTAERAALVAPQLRASVKRLSGLVADLIELTRIRLGSGIPVSKAPVNVCRVCTNAIAEIKAIHGERVFKTDCDDRLVGEWDEGRIGQVLSNLLRNAAEYSPADSAITLIAKSGDGKAEIAVHNDGKPIAPDIMPKLFDPLMRGGKRDTSGVSTGLGLGLYIAKAIVVAHGGTITAQSSAAEGTIFRVSLPLSHAMKAA